MSKHNPSYSDFLCNLSRRYMVTPRTLDDAFRTPQWATPFEPDTNVDRLVSVWWVLVAVVAAIGALAYFIGGGRV